MTGTLLHLSLPISSTMSSMPLTCGESRGEARAIKHLQSTSRERQPQQARGTQRTRHAPTSGRTSGMRMSVRIRSTFLSGPQPCRKSSASRPLLAQVTAGGASGGVGGCAWLGLRQADAGRGQRPYPSLAWDTRADVGRAHHRRAAWPPPGHLVPEARAPGSSEHCLPPKARVPRPQPSPV